MGIWSKQLKNLDDIASQYHNADEGRQKLKDKWYKKAARIAADMRQCGENKAEKAHCGKNKTQK